MARTASILIVSALILAGSIVAAGDRGFVGAAPVTEVLVGDPQQTYGTSTLTAFAVPSSAFTPDDSATNFSTSNGIDRFITTAGAFLEAGPMLPNGSQIERIELRACDTNAGASVSMSFGTCPTAGGGCVTAGTVATGATPGCNNFSTTLVTPVIVNNQTVPLLIAVNTGTTNTTTFSAVKLYYRLRISAAPATATFPNDVPTSHPFFRFVEALAAAGVTSGCGAGRFCPDAAVSRGQMAVFLATALGLHFPN
jgi:S-layer family protein